MAKNDNGLVMGKDEVTLTPPPLLQGSVLEDQLNRLKDYENAVISNKAIMDEMEKIHQQVQESMVFENRSVF